MTTVTQSNGSACFIGVYIADLGLLTQRLKTKRLVSPHSDGGEMELFHQNILLNLTGHGS
jgi:hypothetical protein